MPWLHRLALLCSDWPAIEKEAWYLPQGAHSLVRERETNVPIAL